MKILSTTLLAALILSASISNPTLARTDAPGVPKRVTAAKPLFRVAVFPAASPLTLNVSLEKQTALALTVRLLDEKGTVLDEQRLGREQGNFQYKFNLNNLADGTYSVEVSCGAEKSVHPDNGGYA